MSYPPAPLEGRSDSSPATPGSHAADHTAERDAINAIVEVLGTNPSGTYATVEERLAAIEALLAAGGSGSGDTGGTTVVTPPTSASNVPGYPISTSTLANFPGTSSWWLRGNYSSIGLYPDSLITSDGKYAYDMANPSVRAALAGSWPSLGHVTWALNSSGVLFALGGTVNSFASGTWTNRGVACKGFFGVASGHYWSMKAPASTTTTSTPLIKINTDANTIEEVAPLTLPFWNALFGFAVSGDRVWAARAKAVFTTVAEVEILTTSTTSPGTWDIAATYSVGVTASGSMNELAQRLLLGSAGGGNALIITNSSTTPTNPSATLKVDSLSPTGSVVSTTNITLPAPAHYPTSVSWILLPHAGGRNILVARTSADGGATTSYTYGVVTSGGILVFSGPQPGTLPTWGAGYNSAVIQYVATVNGVQVIGELRLN